MELKPCPFCGSVNVFKKTDLRKTEIYCGKCGATIERGISCGKCDCLSDAEELFGTKAIEAWNRRAENEELRFTRQFIVDHGLQYELLNAWEARVNNGKR